eukprot:1182546-Prorocentrum_minimum.AAC.6
MFYYTLNGGGRRVCVHATLQGGRAALQRAAGGAHDRHGRRLLHPADAQRQGPKTAAQHGLTLLPPRAFLTCSAGFVRNFFGGGVWGRRQCTGSVQAAQ